MSLYSSPWFDNRLLKSWAYALVVLSLATACQPKTEYAKWVEAELEKGVRQDSLFLGIYMGMNSKDFYAHCWELNNQGYFTQGFANHSVMYVLEDKLKHRAFMNFYPTFHEDRIYEMPVKIEYESWAPWNPQTSVDSLQLDVLELMKKWYGEKFIEVTHPETGDVAYVRIDGNRRISISKYDIKQVSVLFTDLTVERERKKNES